MICLIWFAFLCFNPWCGSVSKAQKDSRPRQISCGVKQQNALSQKNSNVLQYLAILAMSDISCSKIPKYNILGWKWTWMCSIQSCPVPGNFLLRKWWTKIHNIWAKACIFLRSLSAQKIIMKLRRRKGLEFMAHSIQWGVPYSHLSTKM